MESEIRYFILNQLKFSAFLGHHQRQQDINNQTKRHNHKEKTQQQQKEKRKIETQPDESWT